MSLNFSVLRKLYLLAVTLFLFTFSGFSADRFWVGGSGSWSDQDHWSLTSGGRGGASVPGSWDNVIIDQNSVAGPSRISLDGIMTCADLNILPQSWALELSGNGDLYVNGSFALATQITNKFSGNIHLTGSGSFEAYSEVSGNIVFETQGTYQFISDIRFSEKFEQVLKSGTVLTNGKAVTFGTFSSPGNSNRKLDLSSSRVTINKGWDLTSSTNLEFIAGTSRIRATKFVDPSDVKPGNLAYNQLLLPMNNICPPLTLITGFIQSPCNNDNTACAWVVATGCAAGSYTFLWNTPVPSSNDTVCNLPPGTYTITVTCAGGEFCDDDVIVTEPAAVRFNSININNPTCFGTCNGSATVSTGGGTAPRTVTWYNFPAMSTFFSGSNPPTGLCSGQQYLVRVVDSRGCTKDSIVTISNPTQVQPNVTSTNVTCFGFANGFATSAPTGGNPASYTYLWNPGGSTSPSIGPLAPGSYTVTVTDASNCTNTQGIVITQPPVLAASFTSTNPTCNNLCDGTISVTVSGGTLPYTYSWSDGPIIEDRTGLCGGAYSLTVTDANNCTVTINVNLVTPPPLPIVGTGGQNCLGTVFALSATGAGVGGTYTWNPGNLVGASVNVNPVSTTTYTVTGTSSAGCANMDTAVVIVNPLPIITATPSQGQLCTGDCVTISASGAGATGTYTWTPTTALTPTTGANVSACPTATITYTVTGTDANGCRNTATSEITVNTLPIVSATPSSTSICSGSSTTLVGTGAGPGATYEWNPGGLIGQSVTVTPGATTTYTVTGTNAATGCTNTATSIVTVLPIPVTTASANPAAVCAGSSTTLTATGGVNYSWNPVTTPATGTPVTATPAVTTTYTVTTTGANNCTQTATVEVTVNPIPTVTATPSGPTICIGSTQTIVASGANTYTWSPTTGLTPSTGSTVSASPASTTTYTVTGTDNIGCRDTAITVVTVNPLPSVTATPTNSSVCNGATVTLNANGGLNYTWNPGGLSGPSITVNPAATTTYTVTGTDANGCIDTARAIVNIVTPFTLTANATTTAICVGSSTTLNVSGAGAGATYTWNPGGLVGASVNVTPGTTTTFTATGSGAGNCVNTDTVVITVNPLPPVAISPTSPSVCVGSCTNITATGAVNYVWNPGGTTNPTLNICPAATTTYTLTGTDANSCVNIDTAIVTVNPLPVITANPANSAVCNGSSVTITANGGVSYTWFPGGGSGSSVTVTPSATFTYTVTGTDANGCTNGATSTVVVNPLPVINASAAASSICIGDSTTLSATGGITYQWNPGALTGSPVTVSPITTTTYTVTGTNVNNCTNTDTIIITVDPLPVVSATASANPVCLGASTTLTGSGAATYTWNPGGLSGTSVVVTPAGPTTYTVTGTNGNACVNTNTIFINTNSQPPITATPGTSNICLNDTVTISAAGAGIGGTYQWSPSTGLNTTSGAVVSAFPVATTTYTVTGTDANGCSDTAIVVVNVNPLPTVTASPSTITICPGTCTTLTASGAGGGGTYSWNPATSPSVGTVVNACPAATTTYTVTGTTQFGCTDTAVSIVTVVPAPVVSVTPTNPSFCSGSNITLTASGANSYTWAPTGSLNTGVGPIVIASPSSTTTYTVTGTTGLGCRDTAVAIVTVLPLPSVSAVAASSTICANSNVTITGTGASTYTWNPGALTGTTITVNPATTTTYTVTGTASNGCLDTGIVQITVIPLPPISAGSDQTICIGNSVTLNATGAGIGGSYEWTPILGLSNPSIASPVATPTSTTTYTVTGTNMNGCSGSDEVVVNVNVPNISAGPDGAMCNGNSVTLNASGAVTYIWSPTTNLSNPNISNPVANPTSQTTYTVTGTDANGCSDFDIVFVTPDTISVSVVSYNTTGCGANNGAIAATAVNGLGAYSYSWSCSAQTTDSISGLSAGACTVTVTDSAGCAVSATGLVSDPTNITATLAVTDLSSCTGANGSIDATVSGGIGAYTFSWSGPSSFSANTEDISGLSVGVYILSITDAVGCTVLFTDTVNAPVPTPVSITPSSATVCPGGSVVLTASPGFASYTWSPGTAVPTNTQTTTATPVTSTVYSVTAVDVNQCTSTASATVTVTSALVANAGTDQTVCPGTPVNLVGSGAGPGGSYNWTPNPALSSDTIANPVATVSATTTFTLTVTDVNNCTATDEVIINVSPLSAAITAKQNVTICGGSNGTLTVTVTGGTNPYTYSWNTFPQVVTTSTSNTISNLPVGIYTVQVTDGFGCTAQVTDSIDEPTTFVATAAVTNATTCNSNDGAINVTVTGGTTPFTFSWSGCSFTSSSQNISNLDACTYTLTVSDNSGCSDVLTAIVTEPIATAVSAGTDVTICNGSSANLNANPSASPTYSWTPAGSLAGANTASPVASPTVTTTYTVSMTDANGCIAGDDVIVNVSTLSLTATTVNANSCGGTDGSATVTVSGGTSPYTYSWSDGQTGPIATDLAVGTYSVDVNDATGCAATLSGIFISSPANFSVTSVATQPTTCVSNDGTITVSVTGGTAPFTYNWSPPVSSSSNIATGLAPGTYSVLIVDSNSCAFIATDTITNPAALPANAGNDVTLCSGTSFTLTAAAGGTGYTWSPPVGTPGQSITVSPATTTTYTVTMTDNNSCSDTDMVVVTVLPVPTVNAGADLTICSGGAATLNPITTGVSVLWSPGSGLSSTSVMSPVASPLTTSTYTITAYSAIGCSATDGVVVNVAELLLSISSTDATGCTTNDGTADVDVTGGSGSYQYLWMPGSLNTDSISGLDGGSYSVTVTDATFGCTATGVANIQEPALFTVADTVTNVTSCGSANGAINLTVTGTTGPYTFTWSNTMNTEDITGLAAGIYSVTVTDTNGCSVSLTDTVTAPAPLIVNAGNDVAVCIGDSVSLNATSTSVGNYSWSPAAILSNPNSPDPYFIAMSSQQFVVTLSDINGCTGTDTVVVTVSNLALGASITNTTTCSATDGIINLNVTGGTSPYTYSWIGPAPFTATTEDLTGLGIGVYSVTVTDNAGCSDTASFPVSEPSGITVVLDSTDTPDNCGAAIGAIYVSISGGTLPYTYSWTGSATSTLEDITGLGAGTYNLVVTDATGCSTAFTNTLVAPITNTVYAGNSGSICFGDSVQLGANGVVSYSWTPATGLSDPLIANPKASPSTTTTYTVTGVDVNGCTTTDTLVVIVNPLPNANAGNDTAACFGSPITLTATGGISYLWSPATGLSNVNIASPQVLSVTSAMTYSVIVTDANGCSNADTVIINVNQLPVASAGSNTTICDGTCTQLNGSSVPVASSFEWSPTTGLSDPTISNPNACPAATTTFTLTVTDANNCTDTASVVISVIPAVQINAGSDVSVCPAFNINLNATASLSSYIWNPTTFLSCTNCASPTVVAPIATTTYTVTGTDNLGCATTDTIVVVVAPIDVTSNVIQPTNCLTNDGSITVSASGGTSPYVFSWNNGTLNDTIVVTAGNFSLIVTDSLGCTDTSSFDITSLTPVIANAGPDTVFCEDGTFTLDGNASVGATIFQWYALPANTLIASTVTTTITPPSGVSIYQLYAANGFCADRDTVEVNSVTAPVANAGPDMTIILNTSGTLGGSPTGPAGSLFMWNPTEGLSDSLASNPVASPTLTTTYVVTVTNSSGCSARDTMVLTVLPQISFPNGFTPNGDGYNDKWIIDNIDQFPDALIEVYNRWGELLFSSVGYSTPWDGTYKGEQVPVGTYYYIIDLKDERFPDGYTGPITIIR